MSLQLVDNNKTTTSSVSTMTITILLSFFAIIIVIILVSKKWFKIKSNLPPGPGKLPFLGHLHLLVSHIPPHCILRDLSLKYGSLMHLQLGQITTLVVSSPEGAKEFLKTMDTTFANRPSLLATEILLYQNTDLGFAPYGEYWRHLRKICALELLSTKRVQSFQAIRDEEFLNLCRWIAFNEGSEVNLSERLKKTNYVVVSRASLGKKNEEQDTFMSVLDEVMDLASGFYVGDLYPSIKVFQVFSGMRQRVEKVFKKADMIFQKIINEHKTAKVGGERNLHEDLLDVLLKYQDDDTELHLTTDNIKAILMDMFIGGSETSSTTVEWAISELLKNPNVLKKVQNEVRQVFKENGCVDESHLDELTYLKLVIKETLRMHPPIPLLLPRESSNPCTIAGYDIPAKTRVLVNAWAIGRDPKYWEEAEKFKPERFLSKLVDYKGNNFEYIPFGSGKRICPGMTFGLANAELSLALLLFHFDWILPDEMTPEQIDMSDSLGATCRRANPLCIIPVVKIPVPAK